VADREKERDDSNPVVAKRVGRGEKSEGARENGDYQNAVTRESEVCSVTLGPSSAHESNSMPVPQGKKNLATFTIDYRFYSEKRRKQSRS
jgi:hypothetical protein